MWYSRVRRNWTWKTTTTSRRPNGPPDKWTAGPRHNSPASRSRTPTRAVTYSSASAPTAADSSRSRPVRAHRRHRDPQWTPTGASTTARRGPRNNTVPCAAPTPRHIKTNRIWTVSPAAAYVSANRVYRLQIPVACSTGLLSVTCAVIWCACRCGNVINRERNNKKKKIYSLIIALISSANIPGGPPGRLERRWSRDLAE